MCGGFSCSKNALIALNILYVIIGILLIIIGLYGRSISVLTHLPIVGGIAGCGIFLITISLIGLAGAIKHHQVILFFYMIILFLLFLIQFSIAASCLAVNPAQQQQFAGEGWNSASDDLKKKVQDNFLCCGFNTTDTISAGSHPSCENITPMCCAPNQDPSGCVCSPCLPKLEDAINYAFKLSGGMGMFFSFTEVIAVYLTWRYRNLHDPSDLPARAVFPYRNYQY